MSARGIFTTIAIRDGKLFLWEKHWRRLVHSAERLGIAITEFRESAVEDSLFAKLVEEGIFDGRAKITFEQEKASELWPAVQGTRTSCSIITGPRRQIAKRFRLGLSPYLVNSRSPLAGLKTTNYLEPTLCFEAAKHEGLDEAIRVNELGHVAGGCFSNVFWLKDGELFTPGTATGSLAGTTREFVMENFEVRETAAPFETLAAADAVFLTSAGIGIVEAETLSGRPFAPSGHPILDILTF